LFIPHRHRPTDTNCGVCASDAYRLADVPISARPLKVPLCAECFLLFVEHPRAFKLSRLVGADRDARTLEWPRAPA
jgi:hypothetical protein